MKLLTCKSCDLTFRGDDQEKCKKCYRMESRVRFLTANLESTEQIQMTPQESISSLGYFCKSHLALLQQGNKFVKEIAEYRVDKCMAAVNLGNKGKSGSSL